MTPPDTTPPDRTRRNRADEPPSQPAFVEHDHHACSGRALEHAERMVREAGLRLTPVRRRTLEILLEEHRALGAYDVLARLAEDGFGNQPPVAYRALDYLVEKGLAHRIRRLNAFAACMAPGHEGAPVFLICGECGCVAELPAEDIAGRLAAAAGGVGFSVERLSIEAKGTCPSCRDNAGGRTCP